MLSTLLFSQYVLGVNVRPNEDGSDKFKMTVDLKKIVFWNTNRNTRVTVKFHRGLLKLCTIQKSFGRMWELCKQSLDGTSDSIETVFGVTECWEVWPWYDEEESEYSTTSEEEMSLFSEEGVV